MKKSILFSIMTAAAFISCEKKVTVTQSPAVTDETNAVAVNSQANDELPENIREFINQHYNQQDIASYEIKTIPVKGKTYEVKFNHGAEIDFDESGTWHEWSDPKGLPDGVLPENIKSYIDQHYGTTFATSIDIEKNEIKVDLASDIDLEFDTNGNFIRIDD